MIDRFLALSGVRDGSLLDAAVMTEKGIEEWRLDTANTCNNGHSSTKLFTSACIGMLSDAGMLSLSDSAASLFPDLWPEDMDPKWKEVTIENVLRHRVGFDHINVDYEGDEPCGGYTRDPLTLVFETPLAYPQGEYYQYSDASYYLLSRVVEAKSGVTMERFIRERLGPVMGLRDFAIASCPMGHTLGGGCMYMRASDMVKLGYALSRRGVYRETRVLSETYVRQMMDNGYGLNRFRDTDIYIKTGAFGQGIAFSAKHPVAAAWHRNCYSVKPTPDRNDTMLECFDALIREAYPG